jgi:predicted HD phosphohydrolase
MPDEVTSPPPDIARFTRMDESTRADYQLISREHKVLGRNLPKVLIGMLENLKGDPLGYQVDRYEHSLQSATRAFRAGASEEMVVAALIHDIGDTLAPHNHPELSAAILKPYVSAETHWIVAHHGIFQGYYYFHHLGYDRDLREAYRGHRFFQATAAFCENWDQVSFDPGYDTMPFSAFEASLQRVFARTPHRPPPAP